MLHIGISRGMPTIYCGPLKLGSLLPRRVCACLPSREPTGDPIAQKLQWFQALRPPPHLTTQRRLGSFHLVPVRIARPVSCDFCAHGTFSPVIYPYLSVAWEGSRNEALVALAIRTPLW